MNQTDTLHFERPFSFAEIKKTVLNGNPYRIMRFDKNLETTINNYLKSPEEIDAEFTLEMNNSKTMFEEHDDHFDTYGRLINNSNAYNPDYTNSGFMEENY
ncbi:MAG: hypothetical protein ACXWWC_15435 [Chitinophagaceae bacterium]